MMRLTIITYNKTTNNNKVTHPATHTNVIIASFDLYSKIPL